MVGALSCVEVHQLKFTNMDAPYGAPGIDLVYGKKDAKVARVRPQADLTAREVSAAKGAGVD
jgi:hypothetical protein